MLSDLQIMNKWASVLTGYKSTGGRIFEFARAIEAEVRKDYEALIRDAIDRVEPAPQPLVGLTDEHILKMAYAFLGDNGPQDSRVVSFARAVLAAKNGLTVKDQV